MIAKAADWSAWPPKVIVPRQISLIRNPVCPNCLVRIPPRLSSQAFSVGPAALVASPFEREEGRRRGMVLHRRVVIGLEHPAQRVRRDRPVPVVVEPPLDPGD